MKVEIQKRRKNFFNLRTRSVIQSQDYVETQAQ